MSQHFELLHPPQDEIEKRARIAYQGTHSKAEKSRHAAFKSRPRYNGLCRKQMPVR